MRPEANLMTRKRTPPDDVGTAAPKGPRTTPRAGRDEPIHCELVTIAASAGGLTAVSEILSALPPNFPVPIAIVQHRSPAAPEVLPRILTRVTPNLRVKQAEEGDQLEPGVVYLAPPDLHLVVRPDRTLHLHDGTKIKFLRSSANPLFESAAHSLDGRVVAVVLTGSGTDATDGVQAVRQMGGIVIAQDPASANFDAMPKSAIASGAVNFVLPLGEIAAKLISLVGPKIVAPGRT